MSEHVARNVRDELLQYLFGLTLHGVKLGMHNIQCLLSAAGNPQNAYPAIHIAGTNGKGSVAAFLDAMLRAAGYRTAKFTSPHLIDLAERFQQNGLPIPADALEDNLSFFRDAAQRLACSPTFFEVCTAVAFRWFQQIRAEVAVVEVGMGGRLDSTNVITPAAAVITNIDLEHTQFLGDTLGKIAYEKAGILKKGVFAVTGEQRMEPLEVIAGRANELPCPLAVAHRDFDYFRSGTPWRQSFSYSSPGMTLENVPLGLAGRYQAENAALAVAVAEHLRETLPRLSEQAIRDGLRDARWPCRMERVLDQPPVIIDVAHNVAGIHRLTETIEDCVTILAVASDKDAAGMIDALASHSHPLILTAFTGQRALSLDALGRAAGKHAFLPIPCLTEAIEQGLALARPNLPLLITGSIYTAGESRRFLMERHGAPPLGF